MLQPSTLMQCMIAVWVSAGKEPAESAEHDSDADLYGA
jgi:hypothetical protein